MRWWLLARLGRAVLAAWGIASLVFLGSRLLPVSPEQLSLRETDDLTYLPDGTQTLAAAQLASRQRLGLAEPVFYWTRLPGPTNQWQWHGPHNQYHHWLGQLLRGSLGTSYRDGQPVTRLLAQALIVSVPLAGGAAVLATGLALGLALYLARAARGKRRAGLRAALAALQMTPVFLVSLALLLLFANPDLLNLMPAAGRAPAAGPLAAAGYWAARAVLPLLSLVLVVLPELTLPLAAALRYELSAGYATTARAKGLPLRRVLRQHALPNAILPLFTILTELLPTLVAGTVVVEVVFALPGSGRLLAEAAATHDYPVVVGGVLLVAAVRLLGLVLADVLYFVVDPRLRPTA
ncbi:ABC transporter permease [Hymenobacter psoromatis]|uniref:ABC transporter permease subunit n=1 Tax=Hymenobacter psoromatis TaxID=1484116 RepID=UPI001CBF83EA|nr:ABC transporter permease [Hymenobacter psoromatis]